MCVLTFSEYYINVCAFLQEFSLCSRMRIGEVLRSKASCFIGIM